MVDQSRPLAFPPLPADQQAPLPYGTRVFHGPIGQIWMPAALVPGAPDYHSQAPLSRVNGNWMGYQPFFAPRKIGDPVQSLPSAWSGLSGLGATIVSMVNGMPNNYGEPFNHFDPTTWWNPDGTARPAAAQAGVVKGPTSAPPPDAVLAASLSHLQRLGLPSGPLANAVASTLHGTVSGGGKTPGLLEGTPLSSGQAQELSHALATTALPPQHVPAAQAAQASIAQLMGPPPVPVHHTPPPAPPPPVESPPVVVTVPANVLPDGTACHMPDGSQGTIFSGACQSAGGSTTLAPAPIPAQVLPDGTLCTLPDGTQGVMAGGACTMAMQPAPTGPCSLNGATGIYDGNGNCQIPDGTPCVADDGSGLTGCFDGGECWWPAGSGPTGICGPGGTQAPVAASSQIQAVTTAAVGGTLPTASSAVASAQVDTALQQAGTLDQAGQFYAAQLVLNAAMGPAQLSGRTEDIQNALFQVAQDSALFPAAPPPSPVSRTAYQAMPGTQQSGGGGSCSLNQAWGSIDASGNCLIPDGTPCTADDGSGAPGVFDSGQCWWPPGSGPTGIGGDPTTAALSLLNQSGDGGPVLAQQAATASADPGAWPFKETF